MVTILCGPVVGLVTQNSANILLDINSSTEIQMTLKNKTTLKEHTTTVEFEAGVPNVFHFDELEHDTGYDIHIATIADKVFGSVRTLPNDVKSIKVAALSCDRPVPGQKDMWDVLYRRASADGVNVVLHLGDNVYMDNDVFSPAASTKERVEKEEILFDPKKVDQGAPYVKARKLLQGLEKEEWCSKKNEILDIYRGKYRSLWTGASKARVLANFSNLMILDDHDIRDDFGSLEQDSDPESKEFFLAGIAVQVYHEYQRQLWDQDILTNTDKLKDEFYQIRLGPLSLIMTDSRLSRNLYKQKRASGDETYLGKDQIKSLQEGLKSNPSTRMHLVSFSLPLVWLKRKNLQLLKKLNISDDLTEFIANHHSSDLASILDEIHNWKTEAGPKGDILLLGGDLHIAGFTDIFRKSDGQEELVCRQVVASAIQNKNQALGKYRVLRGLMNFTETYEDYGYRHYDWTNKCNFALVYVDFADQEQVSYSVEIVNEKGSELRFSKDKDWDHGSKTRKNCCEIL